MHEYLKQLKAKRDALVAEMRSALDDATARDGDLSAEDDAKIKRYDADIGDLDSRMADIAAAIERAANEDEGVTRALDADVQRSDDDNPDSFDSRLRAFLAGESRSLEVKRDLTKGTATAGGDTVATSFYDQLVEHMIASSGILRAGANLITTSTGEDIQIPTTTAHPTAALVAEAASIGENDPAFAQRTLGAYKYGVLVQVSSELVQDTAIDLIGYLSRSCGRAVGNAFGAHAVTGTGTNQPTGVVTSASTGKTGADAVAGVFNADDLIDLYYSVIEEYRSSPSAAWLLRDASVAAMRKLKDGDDTYLWSPATASGEVDTFMGKPVYTDPNVAAVAATAKSVIFGAMDAYWVRQVNGIRFERSDDFAFANDLVSFRCLVRMDGITVDQTGAIKVFAGGAAT